MSLVNNLFVFLCFISSTNLVKCLRLLVFCFFFRHNCSEFCSYLFPLFQRTPEFNHIQREENGGAENTLHSAAAEMQRALQGLSWDPAHHRDRYTHTHRKNSIHWPSGHSHFTRSFSITPHLNNICPCSVFSYRLKSIQCLSAE